MKVRVEMTAQEAYDAFEAGLLVPLVRYFSQVNGTDKTEKVAEKVQAEADRIGAPTIEELKGKKAEPAEAKEEIKASAVNRADIQQALFDLNKKTGKNTAKELIQAMGFEGLKTMPEDKYGDLMERIKTYAE